MGTFINQKITINFIFKAVNLFPLMFNFLSRKIIINQVKIILIFKQRNTVYIEEKECNFIVKIEFNIFSLVGSESKLNNLLQLTSFKFDLIKINLMYILF